MSARVAVTSVSSVSSASVRPWVPPVAGAAEHVMAVLITEDEQDVGVAVAHGSAPFTRHQNASPRIEDIDVPYLTEGCHLRWIPQRGTLYHPKKDGCVERAREYSRYPMINRVFILLADFDPRRFCVVIPPPVGKRRFIDRNIFPFRSTEFVPINNAKGRNRIEGNLVEPPK